VPTEPLVELSTELVQPTLRRRPRRAGRTLLMLLGALVLLLGLVAGTLTVHRTPQHEALVATAGPAPEGDVVLTDLEAGFERGLSLSARGEQARAQAAADEQAAWDALETQAAAEAAAAEAAAEQAVWDALEEQAADEAAAAAPEPAPTAPPSNPPPAPTPVQGDPFDAIAQCESGMNTQAYNPAGPWMGAFQFSQPTWDQYAPEWRGRDPRGFSYGQQKSIAQRLQAARGWGSWPHCAQQLGLA